MTGILRKFAAVILAFGCFISLASCSGNNTAAVAKESKIAQDNSLITGEDEITTQNDVSKDEFERQGIIEQVSLGTSLRDAIRISVEDDLLNDAHGYEYVTYDSLLSNAIVTIEFMVLDNQELHDALNERNIETIDSRYDFFSIAREYEDITY